MNFPSDSKFMQTRSQRLAHQLNTMMVICRALLARCGGVVVLTAPELEHASRGEIEAKATADDQLEVILRAGEEPLEVLYRHADKEQTPEVKSNG